VVLGVDSDPASPLVFASLLLSALGLLVRLWDHDREIRVRVEPRGEGGAKVAVGGRSRYFPALMERELEALRSAT